MIIRSALILTAALALSINTAAAEVKQAFDGRTFVGQMQAEGQSPDQDNFEFHDGKFHSTACDQFGFGAGTYTAQKTKDGASFTAQTTNKEGSKINWQGTQHGSEIKGTAQLSDNNGALTKFTFHGTEKK